MRKKRLFKSACMVMAWVYCSASAQAGQVITQKEKVWAQQALELAKSEKSQASLTASNTMAVLNFTNSTGLEELNAFQKGMAVMLITDLSKVGKLQVVERIKMQALLDEMNLGASGLVDPATAPKVGKLVRARHVSTGTINAGKAAQMDVVPVLVDVPLEKISTQKLTTGNVQDMFKMEKEILAGILDQVKIDLSATEREELKKPITVHPSAALSFFIGIDLSDKGKYSDAAQMYEKAIAEDPDFALAKEALQELKTLNLTNSEEAAAASTAAASTAAGSSAAASSADASSAAAETAVAAGSSVSNVTLVTLGVLAAGGLAVAAGGSSGGSSGGGASTSDSTSPGTTNPTTPGTTNPTSPGTTNGPTVFRTVPPEGTLIGATCGSGSLSFYFNENIHGCSPVAFTGGWALDSQNIISGTVLTVTYSSPPNTSVCPATMTATVSGCQNAAGATMTPKTFTFIVPQTFK